MSDEAATKRQSVRERAASRGNPFRSKLMVLALAIMVIGGAAWAYAVATRPEPTVTQVPTGVSGMAGFTGQSGGTTEVITPAEKRMIDDAAPATFRLGLAFAVGYFLAWGLRVFAKLALLVFGALGVALILCTHFKVFGLDWAEVQDKAEQSFAFLQGKASQFKDFVMGYLPSAGSAVAGTIFGARHKA